MKKGTPKDLKSNPSAGTVRIRFIGYNLSPFNRAPPFIRPQRYALVSLLNAPFTFFMTQRETTPLRHFFWRNVDKCENFRYIWII